MSERGGYDPNSGVKSNPDSLPFDPMKTAEKRAERDRMKRVYKIRQRVVGSIAAIGALTGVGVMAHAMEHDVAPVDQQAQTDQETKPTELTIPDLKPGDTVDYHRGIFELNLDNINVRKSPYVNNDVDNSNRWHLSEDSMTVINPIYVRTDENGDWYMAVDEKGDRYYFSGKVENAISDVEKGGPAQLGSSSERAVIEATTSQGVLARGTEGADEQELIGTITTAN